MTQPLVKTNRKSIDLTFKVNCEQSTGEITKGDITVRIFEKHLGLAIERAKDHIRQKLINFHSFG